MNRLCSTIRQNPFVGPVLGLAMLFVVCIATASSAHARPSIAVLGLEVVQGQGGIDKEATQLAQRLSDELRAQAADENSKYELAPNSAKDLLELKLLSFCSDEGRACMSAIGKDLDADRLLYGKIERRQDDYHVSLKLLNTNSKQMERTTNEVIPAKELQSTQAKTWARALYARLTGVPLSGALQISANASRGSIFVDGKEVAILEGGTATVPNLAEGEYSVKIVSKGYMDYETKVSIDAGLDRDLAVNMQRIFRSGNSGVVKKGSSGWKKAFAGGAIVTAGLAAGWGYYAYQLHWSGLEDDKLDAWDQVDSATRQSLGGANACANARNVAEPSSALTEFVDICDRGDRAGEMSLLLGIGTGVAAAATTYFAYRGWFATRPANKEKQARKPNIEVVPVLGSERLGANVRLEF